MLQVSQFGQCVAHPLALRHNQPDSGRIEGDGLETLGVRR